MPFRWFLTRRDGERVGPFSPILLNQLDSDGQFQASTKARPEGRTKSGTVKVLRPAAPEPRGDDSV